MPPRDRRRGRRSQRRVPTATGPDEETVQLVREDFTRRRRARRWRRVRRWLLALLLLALVLAGLWVVFFSSYLTAERVQVTGSGTVPVGTIERTARVPLHTPLVRVDLTTIEHRVEKLPPVRSARVSRSWPHTVRISVSQRVPVAVISHGGGLQALDDQGVLFGHYAKQPPRLPLVRSGPDARTDALAEGAKILGALPPGLLHRVATLQVNSIDQIELQLDGGRVVHWGSSADSAEKARVAVVLLRRPARSVDVSVPSRPTTR